MDIIQNSAAAITFEMFLSSDHLTPAAGLSPAITIRKGNGTAFVAPTAGYTVIELGSGWYLCTFVAADTAALGEFVLRATAATADTAEEVRMIKVDPVLALLAAVIETNGGTLLTVKQALQLAAVIPAGKVAGIVAGAGTQSFTLRSATDLQVIATITGDDLGNKTAVVLTIP
jgi:hypothetical protein